MTMTRLTFSHLRYAALSAVHQDQVRYHTGVDGPALGYTWSEDVGGQMFDNLRQILSELWAADLIEVETHRIFAERGHRVSTTTRGYLVLREWEEATHGHTPREATARAAA